MTYFEQVFVGAFLRMCFVFLKSEIYGFGIFVFLLNYSSNVVTDGSCLTEK